MSTAAPGMFHMLLHLVLRPLHLGLRLLHLGRRLLRLGLRPLHLGPSAAAPGTSTAVVAQSSGSDDEDDDDSPTENDDEDNSETYTFIGDLIQKIKSRQIATSSLHPRPPIHVGGTPGTGKTAFSLYLLHKLLLKYPDYTFIYRHGDVNPGCFLYYRRCSYFHASIVQLFSDGLLLQLLTAGFTKAIWTVLDGAAAIPTGTPVARTIVLTSPGQQTIPLKHLLKYAISVVNPPWALVEVERVRKAVYGHLSKASVAAAFKEWGGIPRILLDYGNKPEKLSELHDSIYSSDPFVLFRQAGLARIDHANVSGLHFHLIPGQKLDPLQTPTDDILFRYPAYCWATTWLQERFWQVLKNEQGELSILKFLLDRNNLSAARAFAFEPYVFRTIENSGFSGKLHLLTDNGSEERGPKQLGPLTRRSFSTSIPKELPSGNGVQMMECSMSQYKQITCPELLHSQHGFIVQVTVGQKNKREAKRA